MNLPAQIKKQRGLALVETVIVLPVLLFVMLAATEFTNAFIQHTTLTKAVRDGVRYVAEEAIDGSLTMNLDAQLIDETKRVVVYGDRGQTGGTPLVYNLSVNDVTVSDVGNNNIEVRIDYNYSGILGTVLPAFGFANDISLLFNMTATATMRAL